MLIHWSVHASVKNESQQLHSSTWMNLTYNVESLQRIHVTRFYLNMETGSECGQGNQCNNIKISKVVTFERRGY